MKIVLPLKRPSARDLVTGMVVGVGLCLAILSTSIVDWTWMKLFGDDDATAPGAKLTFSATAYCKGTTTAAGIAVRRGIAAADPQLLPAGSIVSLSTGDPAFDGVYSVLDTGPRVQGRVLDLYVWSCNEALQFGRKAVDVTVLRLGWDPQASAPSLVDRLFHRREARRVPRRQPTVAAPETPQGGAGAILESPSDATAPASPSEAPATVVPDAPALPQEGNSTRETQTPTP